VCVRLQRSRINIREQRGLRKQASLAYTRRTAPAYSVTAHPQHTYIHHHTHAHTHIQVTCEIHAHAHTAIAYYDSLQLTSSMYKAKDKAHRAHGQKEIMHASEGDFCPLLVHFDTFFNMHKGLFFRVQKDCPNLNST